MSTFGICVIVNFIGMWGTVWILATKHVDKNERD